MKDVELLDPHDEFVINQSEPLDAHDGFAVHLRNKPENIPRSTSFLYVPVQSLSLHCLSPKLQFDRQLFFETMLESKNFSTLKKNLTKSSLINILITTLAQFPAAFSWQLAYNHVSPRDKRFGAILPTGIFSYIGLNLLKLPLEKIFLDKPVQDFPGVLLSSLPIIIFDGMWTNIYNLGNVSDNKFINFPLHFLLFSLWSLLCILIQAKFSDRISQRFNIPKAKLLNPALVDVLTLTVSYQSFSYLPSIFNSNNAEWASGLGVSLGVGLMMIPIVYILSRVSMASLNNNYMIFSSSTEALFDSEQQVIMKFNDHSESKSQPLKKPVCDVITDCLIDVITSPCYLLTGIYRFFKNSNQSVQSLELKEKLNPNSYASN